MPYALKGIDATVFAVFSAAGLKVSVRPMLNSNTMPEGDDSPSPENDGPDGKRIGHVLKPRGETITVGDGFHPMKLTQNGGRFTDWSEETEVGFSSQFRSC